MTLERSKKIGLHHTADVAKHYQAVPIHACDCHAYVSAQENNVLIKDTES